jgi:hypothetical protein
MSYTKRRPVGMFLVEAFCDGEYRDGSTTLDGTAISQICHGKLEATDVRRIRTGGSPRHEHQCNRCGATIWLDERYPYTEADAE